MASVGLSYCLFCRAQRRTHPAPQQVRGVVRERGGVVQPYLLQKAHEQHWIRSVEDVIQSQEPAFQQRLQGKSKEAEKT